MDIDICVVGLGYIGLPTASVFASNGFRVQGVDISQRVVDIVNRGEIHIEEPGLKTVVQAAIHSGNLRASVTPVEANAFILAVPTPITEDKKADLSYVEASARAIVPYLRAGNLVILESTSPPRTTVDVLAPILAESGLTVGVDLFLAHSPERVLPGRILNELIENDRIIGGVTTESAERARDLYASFVAGEIILTDATTAEMVKLMENTYRDVNIALANELAVLCGKLGINAWDVIQFANHHPRVHLHNPGPGVGGHCISVDPWFLVERLPEDARLIAMARNINDGMPHRVAGLVRESLVGITNPKVTLLGVSYKGNVDDTRESPSLEVIADLKAQGIELGIYDPHVERFEHSLSGLEDAFRDSDCVLLMVDHNEFKLLDPGALGKLMRRRLLIDTRKLVDAGVWNAAGFVVQLLGKLLLPTPVSPGQRDSMAQALSLSGS
ncbi:MAG: nucleotide sugar dehydrogenase [Acidobacteria bacterium]|nr:nucleotide sugar dehydrogenase [Acidobacteriota bacterium]MBI1854924.1 nucleotide sugar dehydrogenase [Chloroflexota bacterium]MBI3488973.1 nucleotide sugar dehydrogenase [Acidobacteriota bacterium]